MNNEDLAKEVLSGLSEEDMKSYKESLEDIANQKITMFGLGGKLKLSMNGKYQIEEMKLDNSVYNDYSTDEITEGIKTIFNKIINKIQTEQKQLNEELTSKIYSSMFSKFASGDSGNSK